MKPVTVCALLTALCVPAAASAYEQGDILLRAGATSIQPDDGANPDDIWVDDDTQLGINIVYMVADNVGIELLASSPFEHDIKDKDGVKQGTTKLLPPTLSAQYYFANPSLVTPYLGAGINYTIFFDEKTGNSDLELENSLGLAVQVGADFAITENWGINVDLRWMDIDTEVERPAAIKGVEVEVDPIVYSLTALYKF